MKFRLFILTVLLSSQFVLSQGISGKIIYENNSLLGYKPKVKTDILYFNDTLSYYHVDIKRVTSTVPIREEDGTLLQPSNTIDSIANKPNFIYFNKNEGIFYSNSINYDIETIIKRKNNLEWKLTDEVKKIGEFTCQKAILNSNKREYIAWFTHDIPVPFGPISINGLHGLILELYSEDKKVNIYATNIEINKENYDINSLVADYDFSTSVSYDEYLKIREQGIENFRARVNSRLPKGTRPITREEICVNCD